MTLIACARSVSSLSAAQPGVVPVLSCGDPPPNARHAYVGRDMPRVMAELGGKMCTGSLDLVSVAMAVTAADTFVRRELQAADGWCRTIQLEIPVVDRSACEGMRAELERCLGFLSGDMWTLAFASAPEWDLPRVQTQLEISRRDSVSLFSGGLDSTIGALDLMRDGREPLLVSHAYRGDASKQQALMPRLANSAMRLDFHANPRHPDRSYDVSMRTRSFNFLAVAAAAASALSVTNKLGVVDLFVPENGFIALNPPLTPRRLGSHSTRTTHPHFLGSMQRIFDALGIPARIVNPYRHKTKGEMMVSCLDQHRLSQVRAMTVSCGKWKRGNQQCGRCVPCLIRRAAFHAAGMRDTTSYGSEKLEDVLENMAYRDDLLAMCLAAKRPIDGMAAWAAQAGPLPLDEREYDGWVGVAARGIAEIAAFLRHKRVLR
jgi:hypothetical protein